MFVIFDASKKTREGAFSYPGPNRSYPVSKVRRIPGSVGPKQSELYFERQVGVGWTPCINYEWTRPRPLSPRVVDLNQCGRGVSRGCRGMTSVVCIWCCWHGWCVSVFAVCRRVARCKQYHSECSL